LGIGNPGDKNVGFLISTTMNPLTTDTIKGDFREDIEVALRGHRTSHRKVDC